jgi:enolase
MWDDGNYVLFKSTKKAISSDELIKIWESWANQYPTVLLEDGMGENDWQGWKNLTSALGSRIELVGDDICCTNPRILQEGIDKGIGNSILIKLNQTGTVSETPETIELAKQLPLLRVAPFQGNRRHVHLQFDGGDGRRAHQDRLRLPQRACSEINQFRRIEERLGAQAKFAGRKSFGR